MVFRLLIIIFLFTIKISYSNIIYDKNEILIIDIEMNNYMNLYENNFGIKISKNEAIKNIVNIKKTIKFLQNNNPNFLSNLDAQIEKEFTKEIFDDQGTLNFIRFQKIRNSFITEYFNNIFDFKDLEIIFLKIDNLIVPISKNNCLTIEKLHDTRNDKEFIKNLFVNLKNNQQNFEIEINDQKYKACMNEELFSNLEREIIQYIHNKTEKDFNNFIYGKVN
jgi:hypothetical protein